MLTSKLRGAPTPRIDQLGGSGTSRARPSVPGMGQDLQPETRLPERVTTTVEKRKGGSREASLKEACIKGTIVGTRTDSEAAGGR